MTITLDSSVIVAALRNQEEKHEQCQSLLESISDAQIIAIQPSTVLSEVTRVIRRRTGYWRLAERVRELLESIDTMNFVEPEARWSEMISDIAIKMEVGIMDAYVIQVAFEHNATFVSLDEEMMKKAEPYVKIRNVDRFLTE